METKTEIIVVHRAHPGISTIGGRDIVISRHASGPIGFPQAVETLHYETGQASQNLGSIGAGWLWLEVVPVGGYSGDGVELPGGMVEDFCWEVEQFDAWSYEERYRGCVGWWETKRSGKPTVPTGAPLEWWRPRVAAWEARERRMLDEYDREMEEEDKERYSYC
jgi:hypothetical protein